MTLAALLSFSNLALRMKALSGIALNARSGRTRVQSVIQRAVIHAMALLLTAQLVARLLMTVGYLQFATNVQQQMRQGRHVLVMLATLVMARLIAKAAPWTRTRT
jgi:hypothetical protein